MVQIGLLTIYINMPKQKRRGILIDGAATVTLDFGQMNAWILYGLAGEDFTADDAYIIPGLEEYRAGVKVIFKLMLHRTGEKHGRKSGDWTAAV